VSNIYRIFKMHGAKIKIIKMKFTSKVNLRFTFNVILGLVSLCSNIKFLATISRGTTNDVL